MTGTDAALVQVRRRRQQPERLLHQSFMQHCRWRLPPDAFAWYTPMGGRRDVITGALMKSLGSVAVFPDIAISARGKLFCVELKSDRGRLSDTQKDCHEWLRQAGATVGTANTLDDALNLLVSWGLLPEGCQ